MKQIILTAEQAQRVAEAREPIEVLDEQGRTAAHLTPLDPADIEAIARFREGRHRCGKGVPAADVRAHLSRLEQIRRAEGLDEPKMLDLLRRMRAGETV